MIESVLEPLFHVSSLAKTWTIAEVGTNFVISNSHLEAESISLYESICDETTGLDIGRCSSARFSFTTLDIDLELINKVFDVSFTFESEPNTPFVVGRFKVVEDRPSLDRRNRTVVMYDALYDVLNTNYASWYNNLTWTNMTLGGFIDSFLSHVGITAETASRAELVNASMPITKTLQTNELSGSTILHAVCEVAGCFGVMTRDNKFRFLYLKSDIEGLFPANDLYPAEDLYPIEPVTTRIDQSEYYPPLWYETYRTPSISKLFITESADSLGTVVGSGDAEYDIVGNFLLFGKEAQELNIIGLNILGVLEKRNYRPFSVSKVGNLCFELGDAIRMSNDRIAVESYILTRTFSGTQGFTDDISAEGTQDYNTVANTASTSVQQLNSKTLKLRQDVDEVSSELTYQLDPTAGEPGGTHNSYAYQTAQQIGSKVSQTDYNGNTISSLINQTATTVQIQASKIQLEGYVSINGGFQVDNSGNVIMQNAELTNTFTEDGDRIVLNIDGISLGIHRYLSGSSVSDGDLALSWATTQHISDDAEAKIGIWGISYEVWNGSSQDTVFDVSDEDITISALEDLYLNSANGNSGIHIGTTTLASMLSDISSCASLANSAYQTAYSAQSDANLLFTAFNSLSSDVQALEAEARNHGWNV